MDTDRETSSADRPQRDVTSTSSLPADMMSQACRRVGLAAFTMAVVWVLVAALNALVLFRYPDRREGMEAWPMPGLLVAATGAALGLVMAWAARRFQNKPELILDLGLLFQMMTGLLVATLTEWHPMVVPMRISWLCVLVVAYPAIAPHTRGKTLLASLITVSMDPICYWVATLRGVPSMHPQDLVWMFAPNYASAVLAVLPAHVIGGLGRQVKKARELGSYQLGALLGSGGMGEVFRAQHRLLARPAAIKLIRPDLLGRGLARQVTLERFRREAQAAALLQSPHTIALFDFGATGDGAFYYAMELLDGLSFEQLVERFGPVPSGRAIHLLRQVCESIAEAHARGLIHRDIKPSNLVATRLGLDVDFVKVLDFGLVKFHQLAPDRPTTLTAPDMTTGTPAYMAPEAALGERTADHRVDIYALGCVGYWLLTGHLLFEGETPVHVMKQHIVDPPVPPSQRTELPIAPELDAVILACLQKQADDRPASVLALDQMLGAVPVAEPWTPADARRWWGEHLPQTQQGGETWDQGTLLPHLSSE
jgi:hypothetical protein